MSALPSLDERYTDPGYSIGGYFVAPETILVICPKCDGPADVLSENDDGAARLSCRRCPHREHTDNTAHRHGLHFSVTRPPCPRCGAAFTDKGYKWGAKSTGLPVRGRLHCTMCRPNKRWEWRAPVFELAEGCDPYFRLPLFLRQQVAGKEIWALNVRHLLDLRAYLGAQLRERRFPWTLTAMKRLPSWMKAASMRPKVIRALEKMFDEAVRNNLA